MTDDVILPRFRSDLEVLPDGKREGEVGYILRDPRTGWVFKLGEHDYYICQHLDGHTTLATLQAGYEARFDHPLPREEFDAFLEQLQQCGFVDGYADLSTEEIGELFGRDPHTFRRLSLWNPDQFFSWLASRVGWCFTRWVFWLSVPFLLFSVWLVARDWQNYTSQFDQIWEFTNVVWLILVGLFLVMIPRAMIYGAACKHFGGTVPAAGVGIARLRPKVFVDVTSLRWLPKSNRVQAIFSHAWSILILWSIGTIGWWLTTPGTRVNMFWLLLSATAGWSALWAWNPKLPKDAYHLLIIWLGIPRFRGRALRMVAHLLFAWRTSEPLDRREFHQFLAFGVGAWTYNIIHIWIIWGAMGSALINVFQGWGALIFLGILTLLIPAWIMKPVTKLTNWLLAVPARFGINKKTIRGGLLLLLIIALLLPYRYETGGPFTILPIQSYEVHSEIEGGRIESVTVKEGQWVNPGVVLGRIDPLEYEKNLKTNQALLDASIAKLNLLRKQFAILSQPPDIEQIQQLEADVRRLQVAVEGAKRDLALTTLRAPAVGKVVTQHIDQKVGQYLKKGDLFAVVENARTVQVEIPVWEGDIPDVRIGATVRAVPWSFPSRTFEGRVLSVASSGTLDPTKTTVVHVLAQLQNPDEVLRSAMTGYAKIDTDTKWVWEVLVRRLLRWIQVEVWYWIP
jgi:biotin carboxyl carrier protein